MKRKALSIPSAFHSHGLGRWTDQVPGAGQDRRGGGEQHLTALGTPPPQGSVATPLRA